MDAPARGFFFGVPDMVEEEWVDITIELPESLYNRINLVAMQLERPLQDIVSLSIHQFALEMESRLGHRQRLSDNEFEYGKPKPR